MKAIMKQKAIIFIYLLLSLSCFPAIANTNADFKKTYDSIYDDFHYRYFGNSDFSFNEADRKAIEDLYNLDAVKENPLYRARIQYLDALICFSDTLPDYEKTVSIIDEALSALTKEKYPEEYAKLILIKGAAYANSRPVESYGYLNEAIQLLDIKKDSGFTALAYNYLALLWSDLGEWENALECITKSEAIFRESEYERTAFFVRSNAYSIYSRMGEPQQVIKTIYDDLSWAGQQHDTTSMLYLNIVLGNSYATLNMPDSAYLYLRRALELAESYHSPSVFRRFDILYSLGKLSFQEDDFEQASLYLEQSLPYIMQLNLLPYLSRTYFMLSEIEDHYGNSEMAYDYLKESVRINDSLAIQEKVNEVQRIKNHTELMSYQQQLQIAEQKAEIGKTRFLLIIFVLLFALLIILFVLFYINRKRQLKDLKIEQLDQQLKNEEINKKLEILELEQQVEEKEREMATTQLLVSEKNKVLEHLLETFKPFYNAKEMPAKIWKELEAYVSSNLKKEDEWEKSKVHFEKVHPDFFKKLKEQFPELTENELRLCAYIRIGMRTKQIAEMLSIDHRSVITNRYHLKKKLNPDKEQSLDDFIRNI